VTRDHPQFQTVLLHEAIDDRDEEKTNPFSYATVSVYNDIEGGAPAYLGEYADLQVSLEFSIKQPHYQAVLKEVAVMPDGVDSPLSAGEASKTANTDLVCLAFYDTMWEGPEALRLAGELAAMGGVSSVALYKAEGGDFACSLRCEFADVLGEKADTFPAIDEAFSKIAASAQGLVHSGVYRVLFAVPKSGSPVGLVAAQLATDEANKRGINTDDFDGGATVVDNITKGL